MKNKSKTNWDKVNSLTDETIDYSDSPEVTEEFFKVMTLRQPNKQPLHIRLDSDVVDFFKTRNKHYQTKINEVLRAYKLAVEKIEHAHR